MGGGIMLISELITWSNQMYEPDETTFETSDARWIQLFNEGISELRDYALLDAVATTDIVDATSTYALPTDCVEIDSVYLSTDDGTNYVELHQQPVKTSLYLYGYYIFNDEITIYTPTGASTDGLKIYYHKYHTPITLATQSIEYNDNYVLGYYALSRIEMAQRNMQDYQMFYAEFLKRADNLESRRVMPSSDIQEGW